MKKIIAVLLALCLCIGMAACSAEEEAKTDILGEWMAVSANASAIFNEDGTGELNSSGTIRTFTWKYDRDLKRYVVAYDIGITTNAAVGTEYDMQYLNLQGFTFYRMDDYDKARTLMLSKRFEEIAAFTENMTKIKLNTPYDLANAVTVQFTGISVVDLYGNDALQIDYSITNERAEACSDATVTMTGKYFLEGRSSATTSTGEFGWEGTIEPGQTFTATRMFDFSEDPQATIDAYGMVIGAVCFELYGGQYYIDLSEYFK